MKKTVGLVLVLVVVLIIVFLAGNQAAAPVVPGMETGTVEEGTETPTGNPADMSAQSAPAGGTTNVVTPSTGGGSTRPETTQATPVSTTQTPVQAPEPVAVAIKGYAYNPGTITVKKGTKVTWTNQDVAKHTVTFDTMAVESAFLGSGESYSYTFDTAGTYPYHCAPHPYMKGTVIVQ